MALDTQCAQQPAVSGTRRGWLRAALYYLSLCAIGLTLLVWDPIGLQDRVDSYSQDLFNLILLGHKYPAAAQDRLSVVLMREEDLRALDTTWPPPYRIHAEVLRNLWGYQPRAIFVDILFRDRRPDASIAELRDTLCRLREYGINVYLASGAPGEAHGGLRPELEGCAGIVAVPKQTGPSDNVTRRYPLQHVTGNGTFPTAAFALYREHVPDLETAAFSRPMELIWGIRPPPTNRKWMRCEPRLAGPVDTAWRVLSQGMEAARLSCPYTATLTVTDLFTRASDPDIEHLIRDRTILYGAYLQGASDIIHAPTHQAQAGVYLHAMALDNLLNWGEHYIRSLEQGRLNTALIVDVALVMLVAALFMPYRRIRTHFVEAIEARARREGGSTTPLGRSLERRALLRRGLLFVAFMLLGGAVVLLASYIAFRWLDLAPRNWIGYLEFIVFMSVFAGVDERFELVRRCIGSAPRMRQPVSTGTTTKGDTS